MPVLVDRNVILGLVHVGAHAEVLGIPIVARDPGWYKTYFPHVALISP